MRNHDWKQTDRWFTTENVESMKMNIFILKMKDLELAQARESGSIVPTDRLD